MRLKLLFCIGLIGLLASCEPALYVTIESHSGGDAALNITFSEANPYFYVKKAETKSIEFTSTAINAIAEYTHGSGTWDDEHLDALVKGIERIEIKAKGLTEVIEDKAQIRNFFKLGIKGEHRNGIRIVIG